MGRVVGRIRISVLAVVIAIATAAAPAPLRASLANPTNTLEGGIRNAILRGDAQELRALLGQASELSANDAAIARRALSSMEAVGAADARNLAGRYGIDWANKVVHALKTGKEGAIKRALFERYRTAEAVFARVDEAVAALRSLPKGEVIVTVLVEGLSVVVRCYATNGEAVISTIQKW